MNTVIKSFILLILGSFAYIWLNDAKNGWAQDERNNVVALYQSTAQEQAVVETISVLNDQIILLERRMEGGIRQHHILNEDEIPEVLLTKLRKNFWNPSSQEELQRVAVDALDTVTFFLLYANGLKEKLDTQMIQYAKSLRVNERPGGEELRQTAKKERLELMKKIDSDLQKSKWMTWEKLDSQTIEHAWKQGRLKWNS